MMMRRVPLYLPTKQSGPDDRAETLKLYIILFLVGQHGDDDDGVSFSLFLDASSHGTPCGPYFTSAR